MHEWAKCNIRFSTHLSGQLVAVAYLYINGIRSKGGASGISLLRCEVDCPWTQELPLPFLPDSSPLLASWSTSRSGLRTTSAWNDLASSHLFQDVQHKLTNTQGVTFWKSLATTSVRWMYFPCFYLHQFYDNSRGRGHASSTRDLSHSLHFPDILIGTMFFYCGDKIQQKQQHVQPPAFCLALHALLSSQQAC